MGTGNNRLSSDVVHSVSVQTRARVVTTRPMAPQLHSVTEASVLLLIMV